MFFIHSFKKPWSLGNRKQESGDGCDYDLHNWDYLGDNTIYDSPEGAGWDKVKAMAYPRTETVEAIFSPEGKSIGVKGAACHEITHVIIWNARGEL